MRISSVSRFDLVMKSTLKPKSGEHVKKEVIHL